MLQGPQSWSSGETTQSISKPSLLDFPKLSFIEASVSLDPKHFEEDVSCETSSLLMDKDIYGDVISLAMMKEGNGRGTISLNSSFSSASTLLFLRIWPTHFSYSLCNNLPCLNRDILCLFIEDLNHFGKEH